MLPNIPSFVTLVTQNRAADAQNLLNAELSDRIMGALSERKQSLAASLFTGPQEVQEEKSEEGSEVVEEEVEQLDELSKDTPKSYVQKAGVDYFKKAKEGERIDTKDPKATSLARKMGNRSRGTDLAKDKIERLEEDGWKKAPSVRPGGKSHFFTRRNKEGQMQRVVYHRGYGKWEAQTDDTSHGFFDSHQQAKSHFKEETE